jgi:hypothetical protein
LASIDPVNENHDIVSILQKSIAFVERILEKIAYYNVILLPPVGRSWILA